MKTIAERLREGMELRQLKQVDIIEKTGINKGALSSYISGKYEPKQNNIYLLAKALDVNEAWLMGHDVSMERKMTTIVFNDVPDDTPYNRALNKLGNGITPTEDELKAFNEEFPKALKRVPAAFRKVVNNLNDAYKNKLLSYFELLNSEGKIEALKRIEELTYIPKYTSENSIILNAAHAIEGATEEEKQHDNDIMDNDELWK